MTSNRVIAFANIDAYFSKDRVKTLEELGFSVVFCRNAGEVLEVFQQQVNEKPAMLITDGLLEHGDEFTRMETNDGIDTGVALYRRLRLTNPKLPIIVYTTENRTFMELRAIDDPYLAAISEFCFDSTKEILEAAQRLLP